MHDRIRMAKEAQLQMWTSVVEKVASLTGATLERGIEINTRRVDSDAFGPDGVCRRSSALEGAAQP